MDQKCIGVDIGGTSVKLGLFQGDGTLLRKWEIPTRKEERRREAKKSLEKMRMLKAYSDSRGAKISERMRELATTIK